MCVRVRVTLWVETKYVKEEVQEDLLGTHTTWAHTVSPGETAICVDCSSFSSFQSNISWNMYLLQHIEMQACHEVKKTSRS